MTKDENIFFTMNDELTDELSDGNEDDNEFVINCQDNELIDFLHKSNNEYDETHDLYVSQKINYQTNYTVKDLLLICDYYGIAKSLKAAKCNKDDIITVLVNFEMEPANFETVFQRKKIWCCLNEIKNDKYMKKYLLISNVYYGL